MMAISSFKRAFILCISILEEDTYMSLTVETTANPGQHIILWSKTGCHFCQEIKQYLELHDHHYINLDVADNDGLRDVLEAKYGIRHVPVVEVGRNGTYTAFLETDLEGLAHVLAQEAEAARHAVEVN